MLKTDMISENFEKLFNAAIWAITFLNESFAIFHIVGVFFIITGIILSNIRSKNEQNSQN